MIGKITRALVGRSIARKHGYGAVTGMAAGLLAPLVIRKAGSLIKRTGSAAMEKRKLRKAPKYLDRPFRPQ